MPCTQRSTACALAIALCFVLLSAAPLAAGDKAPDGAAPVPQYQHASIVIPAASADEPLRKDFSLERAAGYLEQSATAWMKERKCISCHTTGAYMQVRPLLSPQLGKPSDEMRAHFVTVLANMKSQPHEALTNGLTPTQIAYLALGLAEWDARISGALDTQTDEALRLMLSVQSENGAWGNLDCWPPLESSSYHGTTVAATAVATAPGWLANLKDEKLLAQIEKMKDHLRKTTPPNDYDALLLLWTATRYPGLIDETRKTELVEMVWKHQQADGGWSIRTFSTPEAWGSSNRAEKLRAEPEFAKPPSDGHQTGLAVVVLRDAGVSKDDPRIQKAVAWLLTHQRASGRWWTRSLNSDKFHFITYSGTAYPLLALAKCDKLPAGR